MPLWAGPMPSRLQRQQSQHFSLLTCVTLLLMEAAAELDVSTRRAPGATHSPAESSQPTGIVAEKSKA
jgi:hypothetical protein